MRTVLAMLLAAVAFGCSPDGASPPVTDAGEDADTCPMVAPSGTCPSPGQTCIYDAGEPGTRCDCVSPEMVWVCCTNAGTCSDLKSLPGEGALCCVGDIELPQFARTIGCQLCYPDGHEVDISCSSHDRHWRYTSRECTYSVDAGAGADASSDSGAE